MIGHAPIVAASAGAPAEAEALQLRGGMPMTSRQVLSVLCSAVAAVCAAWSIAIAETYPSRYVSVIIQTAPGSGPDVVARIVADRLSQRWGQQVTILNRNGAAGLIAAQAAAAAQPDGYTLYLPT